VTPPAVWSDGMSKDQQIAYMKANVVPKMGPVFQEHDKAKYAEVGCKTCHGPQYKVPKDFLPHLTMKDGKLTAFAEKPEMAKFMMDKVTPTMAAALGAKPYDMQTHQGFGCGGCHTIDMK
jgi:cytochrome c551/c552